MEMLLIFPKSGGLSALDETCGNSVQNLSGVPLGLKPVVLSNMILYLVMVLVAAISPMDEQSFRQFIAERLALNLSELACDLELAGQI